MAKCKHCGAHGFGLKVNINGLCMACLTRKLDESEQRCKEATDRITPDVLEICKSKEKIEQLDKQIKDREAAVQALERKKDEINKQILVASDDIEMESFSLYKPKYSFASSDKYKERLDEIRGLEKDMLRAKSAATCSAEWVVNGKRSEGKKMTNDNIKMLLRSFNNECDAAVSMVKFSNFDRCLERIKKSFETINRLGESSQIRLSQKYFQLKTDELTLAYEWQCKREEEKEALRALREQQREEAKLAKEIEAARKEAEKERKHYIQALETLKLQA